MRSILAICACAVLAVVAFAPRGPANALQQPKPAPSAEAKPPSGKLELNALAWLAGSWKSDGEENRTEEQWSAAGAGSMVGTCRMSNGGKPHLYEFMLIEQNEAGVELRIRHFRWNMEPREEKPFVWRLTTATPDEALFELVGEGAVKRIHYRRPGPDEITCTLQIEAKGRPQAEEFRMKRVHETRK